MVLKKDCEQEKLGESWEISDIDKNETLISEGYLKGYSLTMLIKEFKGDFWVMWCMKNLEIIFRF